MDFRTDYPEYAVIEHQIRAARAERAAVVGTLFANAALAIMNGAKRLSAGLARGLDAERDRRAVEADAFLRRSVPRY
jgi:hypothetical protein